MENFTYICSQEIKETFRAKWYQIYLITLVTMITFFFYLGLAESSAYGFMGLGRLLLTLIQISIIILPIFALITTVRTFVADRESGIWEYNLALPIKLGGFYWGKGTGRFLALYFPLFIGMIGAALLSLLKGYAVPWTVVAFYTLYLGSTLIFFIGVALLISVYARTQEMALGVAFIVWIAAEGFIDALLLGAMLKYRILVEFVVSLALLNPLQSFRMAAIALFDQELTVLGPVSYTIIEKIGINQLLSWAAIWPILLGLLFALVGYRRFLSKDLL